MIQQNRCHQFRSIITNLLQVQKFPNLLKNTLISILHWIILFSAPNLLFIGQNNKITRGSEVVFYWKRPNILFGLFRKVQHSFLPACKQDFRDIYIFYPLFGSPIIQHARRQWWNYALTQTGRTWCDNIICALFFTHLIPALILMCCCCCFCSLD